MCDHGLMQKTSIPSYPQIETSKTEIWQLVSRDRCLKVFQNVIEILAQTIIGLWTKIVHDLKGYLEKK